MSANGQPTAERDFESLEALLLARAFLYEFFHKLFGGKPTSELEEALLGETMQDALEEYAGDSKPLRGFLALIDDRRNEDRSKLLDQMTDEYTRCLIGPAALPAIPFASPHITHDAAALQARTLVFRRCLRDHGYRLKRYQHVPDDHISAICALMARLAETSLEEANRSELDALAICLSDQREVAAQHLVSWVASYATDLRRSKTAIIYPQAAEALAAFAAIDLTFLAEAAFWASECEVAETIDRKKPDPMKTAYEALASLQALALFGLDDCEIVSIN